MTILFGGPGDRPGDTFFECPETVRTEAGRIFEVGDRIRAGGNGVVHQCTDAATGYEYAIKFQLDLRVARLRRFSREQQLLAELKHDHLMLYEGHGDREATKVRRQNGGRVVRGKCRLPFIVMQLARANLFETVKDQKVSQEIYFAQFRGLAHALGFLHKKAIHRDIKPENILVIGERWVLSDYGLCDIRNSHHQDRITRNWEVVGPRFWMSPEANNRSVGRREPINAASDVFQLASVFWFVVNRSHPTGILSRTDWSGPDALFDPIFKALHYDCRVRPANGTEFASMIDAAVLS
jgi:eukaryotic-like serine/threonine-protein kinase